MKHRCKQLQRCDRGKRKIRMQPMEDGLPPPEVIDDWLRKKREEKRRNEQPGVDFPIPNPSEPGKDEPVRRAPISEPEEKLPN